MLITCPMPFTSRPLLATSVAINTLTVPLLKSRRAASRSYCRRYSRYRQQYDAVHMQVSKLLKYTRACRPGSKG
jgi:hypothetical protein